MIPPAIRALEPYLQHKCDCGITTCRRCHQRIDAHENLRLMGYGVCESPSEPVCTCGLDAALAAGPAGQEVCTCSSPHYPYEPHESSCPLSPSRAVAPDRIIRGIVGVLEVQREPPRCVVLGMHDGSDTECPGCAARAAQFQKQT